MAERCIRHAMTVMSKMLVLALICAATAVLLLPCPAAIGRKMTDDHDVTHSTMSELLCTHMTCCIASKCRKCQHHTYYGTWEMGHLDSLALQHFTGHCLCCLLHSHCSGDITQRYLLTSSMVLEAAYNSHVPLPRYFAFLRTAMSAWQSFQLHQRGKQQQQQRLTAGHQCWLRQQVWMVWRHAFMPLARERRAAHAKALGHWRSNVLTGTMCAWSEVSPADRGPLRMYCVSDYLAAVCTCRLCG